MDLNIGDIIQISEINYIITSFNEHIAYGKEFEGKNSYIIGLYLNSMNKIVDLSFNF
jgi:hypothetical protein